MKRIVPLVLGVVVVLAYVLFLIFMFAPGGAHHETSDVGELVNGHLTDHVITAVHASPKDNALFTSLKSINNSIAHVNEGPLSKKLFGIFDMRITKWVMMMWLAAFLILCIFIPLAFKIKKADKGSESRWVNWWESIIQWVFEEMVEPNFEGKYARRAVPYFLSLFFFILFCNYLGMLPGMATATGNLAVTGGLAILTLILNIAVGFIKQGPLWIYKGTVPHGVPFILGLCLLWPIELIGLLIRPFSLTVRLFANMTAGHVVVLIFLFLTMMFQSYFVGIGSVGSIDDIRSEMLKLLAAAFIFTSCQRCLPGLHYTHIDAGFLVLQYANL